MRFMPPIIRVVFKLIKDSEHIRSTDHSVVGLLVPESVMDRIITGPAKRYTVFFGIGSTLAVVFDVVTR